MRKLALAATAIVVAVALSAGVAAAEKPGTDFSGPHYNLNIVGKKADWNGGGGFDNPDRHTMFVPENTAGYTTPNGEPGVTIWMTRGEEFAVLDGNAFDDGECSFQLGPGKYKVYIVAKAKPGDDRYTDITGWIRYIDPATGTEYIYIPVDTIRVSGKQWQPATSLFYYYNEVLMQDQWVFDYLDWLESDLGYTDTGYFWQYDNHGNKLVKLRFYEA